MDNTNVGFGNAISASVLNMWFIFIQYVPRLIGAVIILIIGLIIASVVGNVVRRVIHATKADELLNNTKIRSRFPANIRISNIIGSIVKWFIILATLLAVSDSLGLPQINGFINQILLYIPNVIVAVLILVIGGIASEMLDELVVTGLAASDMSVKYKTILGSVTRYSVLIFAVLAALTQLKIVPQLIEILFAGLVFAGSLAIGLGAKDHVNSWIGEIRGSKKLG